MTRKEEIREDSPFLRELTLREKETIREAANKAFQYAESKLGFRLSEPDFLIGYHHAAADYLLTTPESSPAKEVGAVIYSFGYEANQSHPAPLESQEELWREIEKVFDKWFENKNDWREWDKVISQDILPKFILTRRKEEKP